ncbi:serine threonine protein kinase : Serine/threonine protein kinase related protein-like OS=Blastopirellula marina DSM 3645 GN=DSM3645_25592 PE=4 SV=1: PQQ_3: PQQ_2: PQQ_2 [Gemmata massiliana]|uniref:Pyrrolo-quinoline quinone repeat domain-containing protein n=1 Tax=Gemmata massiliana TaxID=1210884 RepID=A0A6P2CSS2_9BACT|nr:PQQ-binding-like beta-propeller repeat protein [Gemmata massiliana]VTR91145.1 serine threonine protein kinase : Serine/threonine protein kinase related protein-like OS=Blastopirellula marina DSM 3645 GN=DSM3645_25592 PE=4 SV=1: PQQ_3: PQQ_2: PQQ_2 [Gemmata massiliana]
MHRFVSCFALSLAVAPSLLAGDWNQFRGPAGNGHADAKLPTEWGTSKNVSWRKELPGLGWSSPVIAGEKVYLTTAVAQGEEYSLRALCLNVKTGDTVWDQEVFKQGADAPKPHKKNSHASPTPIVEGGKVYAHFGHMGTACLNANDGSKVWAKQELKYTPVHGNGGSPVLAGNHLIFSIDGTDKQAVIALDKATGTIAWQTPRNNKTGANPFSFSTPVLIKVKDQEQLVSAGSGVVMALDPKTGKEIWRATYGGGYSVVPKPVYANGLIYVCTGYNTANLVAVKPDGKGDVTATHIAFTVKKNVPLNPSILVIDDALYMISDNGVLSCLDAKKGTERWNERVGGNFSSSPLLADGLVYLLDEAGATTVFKPGESYEEIAKNKLSEKTQASCAVYGDALLLRTEKALYRIEKK